jgi:hypothetical protein
VWIDDHNKLLRKKGKKNIPGGKSVDKSGYHGKPEPIIIRGKPGPHLRRHGISHLLKKRKRSVTILFKFR